VARVFRRCVARNHFQDDIGRAGQRLAREFGAEPAGRRSARRPSGQRTCRCGRHARRNSSRCALLAFERHGAARARALHRAEGLHLHQWREFDRQRGARRGIRRQYHSAHASGHDSRRVGNRRRCERRNRRDREIFGSTDFKNRRVKRNMAGFNTIDEILEDIRRGKMAVIMDDEDRENEGDLVMAATCVRAEDVNFMARYGRGLICLTLTRERCRQLRLPLMVSETDGAHRTNFTLSIEAAEGVTTGISAHDRAHTVKTAVAPEASPEDLRQPGHIFPLMAQPGGVLTRAGHTEAGCDLARLAGFSAAAMIVEILNDDGTMARRPDLERFAKAHALKIGTIADLIRYRLKNERTVERIYDEPVDTEFGGFKLCCYEDHVNK